MTKSKKIWNFLYYIYLFFFYFYFIINTTVFNYALILRPMSITLYFLAILMILKVALEWKEEWSYKDAIIIALGIILMIPGAVIFERNHILLYIAAILGAKNCTSKKMFSLLAITAAILFSITVAACLGGILGNYVTYRGEGTRPRYAMGFLYTTYFSGYLMVIVAMWAYLRHKTITWIEIVIMSIACALCEIVSNARIDFLTILIIVVTLIVSKICRIKNIRVGILRNRFIKWILILSSDILAVIAILMGVLYKFDSAVWQKISDVLSRRPYSNAVTFVRYPIKFFGNMVIFHNEQDESIQGISQDYYVINCSYVEVLALLGIGTLLAMLFMWTLISYREYKRDNMVRLMILCSYSLLFFLEQRMMDFAINPFFILLMCADGSEFFELPKNEKWHKLKSCLKKSKPVVTALFLAITLELTLFNIDALSSSANQPMAAPDVAFSSGDLIVREDTNNMTYECETPSIIAGNVFSYLGIEGVRIDLNLYSYGGNEEYRRLDNVDYDVDIYVFAGDDFEYLKTVTINTSDPVSTYIPLYLGPNAQAFKFDFHFKDKYLFEVYKFEFNGAKPFDIKYYRIIIVWIVLSLLSLFVVKKKDNKKKTVLVNAETENSSEIDNNENVNDSKNSIVDN